MKRYLVAAEEGVAGFFWRRSAERFLDALELPRPTSALLVRYDKHGGLVILRERCGGQAA